MRPISVGNRLRQWRERRGFTQAELAQGLFDRSYISQIESGQVIPPLQTMELLCQRLNMPLSELIGSLSEESSRIHRQAKTLLRKGFRNHSIDQVYLGWELLAEQPIISDFIKATEYLVANQEELDQLLHVLQRAVPKMLHEGYVRDDGIELMVELGNAYFKSAQYLNALSIYQMILDQQRPSTATCMRIHLNMGSTLYALDRYEESLDAYQNALSDATISDNRAVMARCHHGLGIAYRALGFGEKAYEHTLQSSEFYHGIDELLRVEAIHNLGVILIDRGDLELARNKLLYSMHYYEDTGHQELIANVLEELGRISVQEDNFDQSLVWCNKGLECVYQTDNVDLTIRLLSLKSSILRNLGSSDMAIELEALTRHLKKSLHGR